MPQLSVQGNRGAEEYFQEFGYLPRSVRHNPRLLHLHTLICEIRF